MKITDVTVKRFSWPKPKPIWNGKYVYKDVGFNLVQVETDEGVTGIGWGGGTAVGRPGALWEALVDHFKQALAPTGLNTLLLDAKTLVPGRAEAPDAEPSDIGAIIYTSGTSGDPKGVCLTFDNLVQNAKACIEHARMDPQQVFLSVIPQFHSFGFTAMTVLPLLLGATAWYLPRFSPVAVVSTIAEKRVTIFMAIASMYGVLARMKETDREALSSLKLPMLTCSTPS